MMTRTFRRASRDDARAIVALHELPHARDTTGRPPTEAQVVARLDDPDFATFVIERERATTGFILVSIEDGWLGTVRRVISARPGSGSGTFAIAQALRYLFDERSCQRAYLEVVASNDRARRLYERFGFVREGTWREGYRKDDGTFVDLCAYGLLEREYRAGLAIRE